MVSFCRLEIMSSNLKEFLGRYQRGIEVCVAGGGADTLLGVRDAFRRYFHEGLERPVPVAVVPQEMPPRPTGLPVSDLEALETARRTARELEARLPGTYHFYLANEACIHSLEIEGQSRYFIRSWSVLVGVAGESCGSSGSIQLPQRLVESLEGVHAEVEIPGKRKSGGTIASLTGGLETRRSAVATATLHALSTLFYGILESRRGSIR